MEGKQIIYQDWLQKESRFLKKWRKYYLQSAQQSFPITKKLSNLVSQNLTAEKNWFFHFPKTPILKINRRWAVCTSDHLYTFETQEITKSQPTETIQLKSCKGVKSAEDDTKKENSFVRLAQN